MFLLFRNILNYPISYLHVFLIFRLCTSIANAGSQCRFDGKLVYKNEWKKNVGMIEVMKGIKGG